MSAIPTCVPTAPCPPLFNRVGHPHFQHTRSTRFTLRALRKPLIGATGLAGVITVSALMAMPLAASATAHWTVPSIASTPGRLDPVLARASRSEQRVPLALPRMRSVTRDVAVGPTESGQASWYGGNWAGRTTASGSVFRPDELTAAHKWLPFGTRLRVCTAWACVVVRVTDRGPYVPGRIVDLSQGAAGVVGLISSGVAFVTVTPIDTRTVLEPIPVPVALDPIPGGQEELLPHGPGHPQPSVANSRPSSAPRPAPAFALAPLTLLGALAGARGRMVLPGVEGDAAVA